MAGTWHGHETMMPSPWCPESQSRERTVRSRMLDGFFLVADYEQRAADGTVTFRGHGAYAYGPQRDHDVMYWFDSMGGAGGVATGRFDGDVPTFENTSPMGHHRYRYVLEDAGRYRFAMAMSRDGESWQDAMVGEYAPAP